MAIIGNLPYFQTNPYGNYLELFKKKTLGHSNPIFVSLFDAKSNWI